MVDHKQATEVIIAATDDRSEFSAWVIKWWKVGAAILLAGSVAIVLNYQQEERRGAQSVATWEVLGGAVPVDRPDLFTEANADVLAAVASGEAENLAGPWARYLEASVRDQTGDTEGALAALAELESDHPNHLLNTLRVDFPGEAAPMAVVERLSTTIEDRAAWEAAHPTLFDNPEPAPGSPSVRITTTEGPILVTLYSDLAPKHVENFLKLCREGFYTDTKFHRVIADFMVQGGDPNSKEADVDLWGLGGPGYKVDREENNLRHFTGYLAAAKMGGEVESSGSQFYITTGTPHHLDGQHVVFGKVIEGMETVRIIESAAILPGTSRPETPASISSTEVL